MIVCYCIHICNQVLWVLYSSNSLKSYLSHVEKLSTWFYLRNHHVLSNMGTFFSYFLMLTLGRCFKLILAPMLSSCVIALEETVEPARSRLVRPSDQMINTHVKVWNGLCGPRHFSTTIVSANQSDQTYRPLMAPKITVFSIFSGRRISACVELDILELQ